MRIPQRTCIGCYKTTSKKELLRIARCSDNSIVVDIENNKNGRGAYVCANEFCIDKAIRGDKLNKALKINPEFANQISNDLIENIKKSLSKYIKR